MIIVHTEGKDISNYSKFIDECIVSLFPKDVDYDIYFEVKKFIEEDGSYAGLCVGDSRASVISIATHWIYEDGEEIPYEAHELASNIAHELVHAKQFCKGQINMIDNVWKHNNVIINCDSIEYLELPWEVEAYAYETVLTDILWENL